MIGDSSIQDVNRSKKRLKVDLAPTKAGKHFAEQ
jgi:hypothetical protein